MMNAVAERDHVLRLMKMSIVELRHGYAKVSMPLEEPVKNGMGFAHGGAIFSIADIAFGAAANEDSEKFVVTLNTSIEYLKPGVSGPLIAEAHLVREGKRIKNYEVLVYDGSETLIARVMTTGYETTAKVE